MARRRPAAGLTLRGYARHRRAAGLDGGTLAAVQKALAAGRIRLRADGTIDPAAADAAWAATTRPAAPPPEKPAAAAGANYQTARAVREAYAAQLAKLEFEERAGTLVPVREAEARFRTTILNARAKFLGLPTRYKQRRPHLTREDLADLDVLVRETLEELAAATPRARRRRGRES